MGAKTALKTNKIESFVFYDTYGFTTTEQCIFELLHLPFQFEYPFFVLPSVTCECNPKILELLYQCVLPYHSIHLQQALIWVS